MKPNSPQWNEITDSNGKDGAQIAEAVFTLPDPAQEQAMRYFMARAKSIFGFWSARYKERTRAYNICKREWAQTLFDIAKMHPDDIAPLMRHLKRRLDTSEPPSHNAVIAEIRAYINPAREWREYEQNKRRITRKETPEEKQKRRDQALEKLAEIRRKLKL